MSSSQAFSTACRRLATETNASCHVPTIPSHESCAKMCKVWHGFCSSICFSRGCSGSWFAVTSDIVMANNLGILFLFTCPCWTPQKIEKKVLWCLISFSLLVVQGSLSTSIYWGILRLSSLLILVLIFQMWFYRRMFHLFYFWIWMWCFKIFCVLKINYFKHDL